MYIYIYTYIHTYIYIYIFVVPPRGAEGAAGPCGTRRRSQRLAGGEASGQSPC